MRRIQSLFKTLLMLIPMTAVPVMAIFGIPQFFPVSASPSARTREAWPDRQTGELRVGQSDACLVRGVSIGQTPSIDLFRPYDTVSSPQRTNSAGVVANGSSSELERWRGAWSDPLRSSENTRTEVSLRTTSTGRAGHSAAPITAAAVHRHVDEVDRSGRRDGTSSFSQLTAVSSPSSRPQSTELASSAIRSDVAATTSAGIANGPEESGRFSRSTGGDRGASSTTHAIQVESLTWQQAVARLNQLGIRTFRLTPDSEQNGYRFVCLVTSVDDPRISRRFEAESNDPLIAVGNVLVQVENWNQHR